MHQRKTTTRLLILSSLLFSLSNVQANSNLKTEREIFRKAEYALKKGRPSQSFKLAKQIKTYPLYPYLQAQRIKRYISTYKPKQIHHFLNLYQALPVNESVHKSWLQYLAKRRDWPQFIKQYRDFNNTELSCHYTYAKWQTQQLTTQQVKTELKPLWLVSQSQPKACDPLFKKATQSGVLNTELIWQRITLASQNKNRTLVRYLKRFVPHKEQKYINDWLYLDRNPNKLLSQYRKKANSSHPFHQEILSNTFNKLIRKDDLAFLKNWPHYQKHFNLSPSLKNDTEQQLAIILAVRNRKQASSFLEKVHSANPTLNEWRIRYALRNQQWQQAEYGIKQLPKNIAAKPIWQYWSARITEQLDSFESAKPLLESLAKTNHYYGLMAKQKLNKPIEIANKTHRVSEENMHRIEQLPGITRARELYLLHKLGYARQEWESATNRLSQSDQVIAAKLAKQWAWYDRAIATAYKAQLSNNLQLTYPLANQDKVLVSSRQHNIDPVWAFAIARQESLFTTDAKSRMGALGVMQLLPKTAKEVAKRFKVAYKGPIELLNPDKNIQLGTAYLSKLTATYPNNPILATAAYNAGPNRVAKWIPEKGLAADIWIDTIPYSETRQYLKNIITNTVVYKYLLGRTPNLDKAITLVG